MKLEITPKKLVLSGLAVFVVLCVSYFWRHADDAGRMVLAGLGAVIGAFALSGLWVEWKEEP